MAKYTIENGYEKRRRWPFFMSGFIIGVIGIFSLASALHKNPTTPKVSASQNIVTPSPAAEKVANLSWPHYGQSAYGVLGDNVLTPTTDVQPVPIASLAKVITALVILEKKPIAVGEQGPSIVLTQQDIALYEEYVRKSGTVLPIEAGESITQHQALQAMLMTSSNNIADTLAVWAFGSMENYNKAANEYLKQKGLLKTTVEGASGYSPNNKSTATDMVKIGMLYIQNPVLKEIALQQDADVPFAGKIRNYNSKINDGQIVGIKVGYTDEAGRTFLAADIRNSNEISVVAVLGAEHLDQAMQDAKLIFQSGNSQYDYLRKNP